MLRDVGLVEERAEGRFRYYRLQARPLASVLAWVERYRAFWEGRLDALATVLDEMDDEPASRPSRKPGRRRRT
jgi:hypothetical protein